MSDLWHVFDWGASHFDVGQPVHVLQPGDLPLDGCQQPGRHNQPQAADERHDRHGNPLLGTLVEQTLDDEDDVHGNSVDGEEHFDLLHREYTPWM